MLAPIAIGLSLAAFAVHVNQYAKSGVDMWPPTSKNIGNWATLGGDALGAIPGVGPAVKGLRAGKTAFTAAEGAARVTKGAGTGAKAAWSAARGTPSHFTGVATSAAEKLGATTHAATIGKSTEAAVTGALTAPTGATLFTGNDTVAEASVNATKAGDLIGTGELAAGPIIKIKNLAKAL